MRALCSRKSSEDTVLINGICELFKTHVRDGQIVLDALYLGRHCSEHRNIRQRSVARKSIKRLVVGRVETDHQDRKFVILNTFVIDDKAKPVGVVIGKG